MIQVDLRITDYNELRYQIKLNFIRWAKKRKSVLSDVDWDGSNINTIIDIFAYVALINNLKIDLLFDESNIKTSSILNNVIKLAMNMGSFDRLRNKSSCVAVLTLKEDVSGVATIPAGVIKARLLSNQSVVAEAKNSRELVLGQDVAQIDNLYFEIKTKEPKEIFKIDNTSDSNFNKAILKKINICEIDIKDTNDNTIQFKMIDNNFNLDTYEQGIVYYFIYRENNNLVIEFENFFSPHYSGTVVINYMTTTMDGENTSINDYELFEGCEDCSNVRVYSDEVFIGGDEGLNIETIRNLAPLNIQSAGSLVSEVDYYQKLQYEFPNWGITIIGGDKLPPKRNKLGAVFFSIHKIENGVGVNLGYDNVYEPSGVFKPKFDKIFNSKISGILPIYFNKKFSYISIKSVLLYNESFNPESVKSKANKKITEYFNEIFINKINENPYETKKIRYLSVNGIKQSVVESSIQGMIDYDIISMKGVQEILPNIDDINKYTPINYPLSLANFDFNKMSLSYYFEDSNYNFNVNLKDMIIYDSSVKRYYIKFNNFNINGVNMDGKYGGYLQSKENSIDEMNIFNYEALFNLFPTVNLKQIDVILEGLGNFIFSGEFNPIYDLNNSFMNVQSVRV